MFGGFNIARLPGPGIGAIINLVYVSLLAALLWFAGPPMQGRIPYYLTVLGVSLGLAVAFTLLAPLRRQRPLRHWRQLRSGRLLRYAARRATMNWFHWLTVAGLVVGLTAHNYLMAVLAVVPWITHYAWNYGIQAVARSNRRQLERARQAHQVVN